MTHETFIPGSTQVYPINQERNYCEIKYEGLITPYSGVSHLKVSPLSQQKRKITSCYHFLRVESFIAEMPCSMMPMLELDNKMQIPQSMAMARYLAREFGK